MSRSQVFTKIFHFSKNSRHHALKANLNWLTKTSLVCYWEWRSCIFSLPCQFEAAVRWRSGITSQELKPLLIARKIRWWNTSLNISISSISGRFPPSSITFGLMNYFNWFIYYHMTEFGGGGEGGGKKIPLPCCYKIWLLHHTFDFDNSESRSQLVECRLVHCGV